MMIYGKKKALLLMAAFAAATSGAYAQWDKATPAPLPTQVQPQLHVQVGKDTDAVTFVNTNNDPFVFTKVYVLKHADPYEIRPYVMDAVRARRIDSNETKVEAVKYMDGTGMLIVSAEEYRFTDPKNGMSIDKIIEALDQPGLSSTAGRKFYLYFPKYWDASSLSAILTKVGLVHEADFTELGGGTDSVRADVGLNAMFIYSTPFSIKTIQSALNDYDTPTSEAVVKYTIYELDYENDGDIGMDFQAWKNGPGSDLFSAGSRYGSGWDFANNEVASNATKNSHASYINFNPKWNSKYLDFMVAKSKAKVMTSGSMTIMNNCTANIASTVSIPTIVDGADLGTRASINQSMTVSGGTWNTYTGTPGSGTAYYTLSAVDVDNRAIRIGDGSTAYSISEFVVGKSTINNSSGTSRDYYTLTVDKGSSVHFYRADGKDLGRQCSAYNVSITLNTASTSSGSTEWTASDVSNYSSSTAYTIYKDKARVTQVGQYGFTMSLTPQVCDKVTTVNIDMSNTNLIGFKSDGNPRTSQTDLKTQVMVNNDGNQFYIGGLDKKAVVKSSSKVPLLGSIPGLGWVFGTENEITKKTQIVAVLEIRPVAPDTAPTKEFKDEAAKTVTSIDKSGIKNKVFEQNSYGFDQYLLDPDKGK